MRNWATLLTRDTPIPSLLDTLRSHPRQSRQALVNWGVALFGLLLVQGIGAVTSIVVARGVSPTEYGQYLSSFGLASLLVVVPGFGMDTWLLAAGGLSGDQVAYHWRRLLRTRLALLVAWLLGILALTLILPSSAYPPLVFWSTALAVALESLVLLAHSALRSVGRHSSVTVLQALATLILFGVTLLLRLRPGEIVLFSLSRALIWLVVTPLSLWFTWRLLPAREQVIDSGTTTRSTRDYLLGDLAAAIYTRAPLTVVSLYLGSTGATTFGPAANLIVFTYLVPNALYFVVLPLLARVFKDSPTLFRRTGLIQLVLQGAVGLTISLATIVLGEFAIVRLLGSNYAPSVPSLLWLSPIPFFKALNFGLAAVLTSSGRQIYRSWAQVICAVFSVAGSVLFVTRLGLVGVILVFMLGEVLLLIGYTLGAVWPRARQTITPQVQA